MTDERSLIDFDTEYVLGDVFPDRIDAPDSMRRCTVCGANSRAWPASELTVIKRRHATQPLGHLVLYCHEHIATVGDGGGSGGSSGRLGPVCPQCQMTVPAGTIECDVCGWTPTT